ncbi:MAG: hypothetical protein C0391_07170 [Anaerolinea sp.]|nr:hypothetical protein [Anaerolinea sp.]
MDESHLQPSLKQKLIILVIFILLLTLACEQPGVTQMLYEDFFGPAMIFTAQAKIAQAEQTAIIGTLTQQARLRYLTWTQEKIEYETWLSNEMWTVQYRDMTKTGVRNTEIAVFNKVLDTQILSAKTATEMAR